MAKQRLRVLQPTFYDEFSCAGPACSDNCCHTWRIDIDKATYLRYKSVRDPDFAARCAKALTRNRGEGAGTEAYALIRFDEEGRCLFEDADRLCSVHRTLGPEYLSQVCAVYPRQKATVMEGVCELSLSMSCEEAVRLGVFGQDAVAFELLEKEIDSGDRILRQKTVGVELAEGQKGYRPYVWQMREAGIDMMQCRACTVPERILAIGMMLRKAGRQYAEGDLAGIVPTLRAYLASMQAGEFKGLLDGLDYDRESHFAALTLPVSHLLLKAARGDNPLLTAFVEGIRPHCAEDGEGGEVGREALAYLLEGIGRHCEGYLRENARFLENYFVSYMFSGIFPFRHSGGGVTPEQNVMMLAEQYAFLRILLCEPARRAGGVTQELLTRAFTLLASESLHSSFGQQVVSMSGELGLDGIGYVSYLLR